MTKPKKIKKTKILKVDGNITYLESNLKEKKRKPVSAETRALLSRKRRALTKQPREGQSKKNQNFYQELIKDYVKQKSALGRYISRKDKIKLEQKKQEVTDFLMKKKEQLVLINASCGIFNEYDVQKANFNQIKMTEELLINIEESNYVEDIDEEFEDKMLNNIEYYDDLVERDNLVKFLNEQQSSEQYKFTLLNIFNFEFFLKSNLVQYDDKLILYFSSFINKMFILYQTLDKKEKSMYLEIFYFYVCGMYKKNKMINKLLYSFAEEKYPRSYKNIEYKKIFEILK